MTSVYGEIITGTSVRRAAEATIRRWFPGYLAEVARQTGWDGPALPSFRSYVTSTDVDRMVEDQLPSCIIVAPGLADAPIRHGDGKYSAMWIVNMGVAVSGQDRENTMELAEMYAAALRTIMLQRRSLGGFAQGVEWVGEGFDELDRDDVRTLCVGYVQFLVDVAGIVDIYQGPTDPPVDPTDDPGEWPTVGSVSVTVEQRRVDA